MTRSLAAVSLILLALPLAGCSSATTPEREEVRLPGLLRFYGDAALVTVPERVAVGEAFTVTVRTFGGGCARKGETELALGAATAVIEPYDYDTVGTDVYCPAVLRFFDHEATLRFQAAGTATVVVEGREAPGDVPARIEVGIRVE